MKRNIKITWILIGVVVVSLVIGGFAFANPLYYGNTQNSYTQGRVSGFNNGYGYGSMMSGFNGGYGHMGYMMGSWNGVNPNINPSGEKMTTDKIKEIVEEYITSYGDNLEVGDMFIYKDTDYYVSIEEKDTGKGAMELLVNPYTGYIYPEFGPNMMWNTKYGMHGSAGFEMMGMRRWNSNTEGNYSNQDSKQIDRETAVKLADVYIKDSLGKEYSVENEGHEFYGYYTFHLAKGEETVGMLSVNYYKGNVWVHEWHGDLEKVISQHKE